MSTKVGIIAEGPIDHTLLSPLLERIARDRCDYDWPVGPDDIAEVLFIRKRGHGGVLATVRRLVVALESEVFDHAFFVILLDRRTRVAQEEIRQLLVNRNRFVLGIAIEEIEAWWLADRHNTLTWANLAADKLPADARYAQSQYQAERDDQPKAALDELTRLSNRFDRYYGEGNVELARDFAEDYWRQFAGLDAIRTGCPHGYRPFERDVTQQFRAARQKAGRLF